MKTLQRRNKALIKFEGRSGGPTFDKSKKFRGGTTRKAYPLVIGSNQFIGPGRDFKTGKRYRGFEEQLIGMEKGQKKDYSSHISTELSREIFSWKTSIL